MLLRVHRILDRTCVVGPGVRFSIWVQGCHHCCQGCSAIATWSAKKGYFMDASFLVEKIMSTPDIEGVTFIGGEPFEQAEVLSRIAKEARKSNLSVVTFTGYTYSDLVRGGQKDHITLLEYTDLLIDGPFIEEKKSSDRPWVGSENQNYIFLTGRYTLKDILPHFPKHEFHIKPNGQVISNGLVVSVESLGQLFGGHRKL